MGIRFVTRYIYTKYIFRILIQKIFPVETDEEMMIWRAVNNFVINKFNFKFYFCYCIQIFVTYKLQIMFVYVKSTLNIKNK